MKKIEFRKTNNWGLKIYFPKNGNNIQVVQNPDDSRFYIKVLDDGNWVYPVWGLEGFVHLSDAEDFLNLHDWRSATPSHIDKLSPDEDFEDFQLAMDILGFEPAQSDKLCYSYEKEIGNRHLSIQVKYDDGKMSTEATIDNKSISRYMLPEDYYYAGKLIRNIERLIRHYDKKDTVVSAIHLVSKEDRQFIINCAINTKRLTMDMVKVKSSNIWGYNINIKDSKQKFGDVVVQFKGKNGGPGDIYMYYDVPVLTYRRWHTAPSKGHYFWVYIRNYFKYSKLTGNKRGVLKNAVN